MTTLVFEAHTLGVPSNTLDVNITAKNFFLSHGFVIVGSRMNMILGHSAPNFSMMRHLSPSVLGNEAS